MKSLVTVYIKIWNHANSSLEYYTVGLYLLKINNIIAYKYRPMLFKMHSKLNGKVYCVGTVFSFSWRKYHKIDF
jgi:hypothetical protein